MIDKLDIYIEGANIPVKTIDGKVTKRVYFNFHSRGLNPPSLDGTSFPDVWTLNTQIFT